MPLTLVASSAQHTLLSWIGVTVGNSSVRLAGLGTDEPSRIMRVCYQEASRAFIRAIV